MDYETILYSVEDGVATVALNRPDRMNSLNGVMRRELMDALGRAPREGRCLVLTGTGRGFCSGQDLNDASAPGELDLERTLREEYEPLLRRIYDCPVPTVAAVNGPAAGAGANLALAADLVIAAKSAVFIEAFARIGLIPDAGGTYWLPRMVGLPRAMGMCLTTDPVPAEQAEAWGLVWRAVADDDFAELVAATARRLASGPTAAYLLTRQALRRSFANTLDEQLALEAALQGEAGRTRDFREGVAAFLEKRPPVYEGR
ncbi:MAG TPA: enoyl-CoA hydratase-related protein [Thermohalobaculum sp.]|nr:enoyl-CoA hydratase-related protein [Thermohalobaculum sp.]